MNQQEAQNIVNQINEFSLYGESREEYVPLVRELADEGYGIRWDGQEYVLTDIPDLSVLEQELKKNGK